MGEFDLGNQDPRKDIRAKYRALFDSPIGREVLRDILINAEFGSILHPENYIKFMWHNIAITILKECGMIGPDLMDQVVNGFCNVIPTNKEVER